MEKVDYKKQQQQQKKTKKNSYIKIYHLKIVTKTVLLHKQSDPVHLDLKQAGWHRIRRRHLQRTMNPEKPFLCRTLGTHEYA